MKLYNHPLYSKSGEINSCELSPLLLMIFSFLVLFATEKRKQLSDQEEYIHTDGFDTGVRFPNFPNCGSQPPISKTSRKRHRRIVNGERSKEGEFPWSVFITPNPDDPRSMLGICSGVLINEYWVLTAAHCV